MSIYTYLPNKTYEIGERYHDFDKSKLYDLNIYINDNDYFVVRMENIFSNIFLVYDKAMTSGYAHNPFSLSSTQ